MSRQVKSWSVDSHSELAKLIEMVPAKGCEISVRFKLPVARVDERYTSVEAESRLKGTRAKKAEIDSVAAQLILEQYFDEAA